MLGGAVRGVLSGNMHCSKRAVIGLGAALRNRLVAGAAPHGFASATAQMTTAVAQTTGLMSRAPKMNPSPLQTNVRS